MHTRSGICQWQGNSRRQQWQSINYAILFENSFKRVKIDRQNGLLASIQTESRRDFHVKSLEIEQHFPDVKSIFLFTIQAGKFLVPSPLMSQDARCSRVKIIARRRRNVNFHRKIFQVILCVLRKLICRRKSIIFSLIK